MAAKKSVKKPAKKPAKASRTAGAKGTLVRGVALVEQVIAKVLEEDSLGDAPAPLAADVIAALRFPGDAPLPPSLARWLAFDAQWVGLFDDLAKPTLPPRTFREMMLAEFDEQTADVYEFGSILPGNCYCLPHGSDSRRFLYVGKADGLGEYPVLVVDTDDTPFVCIEYPGFDVYLAMELGELEPGPGVYGGLFKSKRWRAPMVAQARLNLHGFQTFDYGAGDTEHVDGEEAADEAMSALMGDG